MNDELLKIESRTYTDPTIIKVIGVGGGGGNAVNYMYSQDVKNVSYLLCNTDRQHLQKCSIPDTIVIGEKLTGGLGAGNDPEIAKAAAEESKEAIQEALNDGTRMVFITAGMGGGTGTGAAPVIARVAKDMGILTVGIVTIPFLFEGERKIYQAIRGVEELQKNVDAILVVQNELLYKVYPDLTVSEAFKRADETLTTSARSISELITLPAVMNVDFADVRTTLKDGGVSIITRGFSSKSEGIRVAIDRALNSPLVNTTNFDKATRVLFLLTYKSGFEPKAEVVNDLRRTTDSIKADFNFIWGYSEREDEYMEDELGITILASGFGQEELHLDDYTMAEREEKIRIWYPESMKSSSTYSKYGSVIFTEEELDDDTFIALVSDKPTLTRREEDLTRYRNVMNPSAHKTRKQDFAPVHHTPENKRSDDGPQTIDSTLIRFGINFDNDKK